MMRKIMVSTTRSVLVILSLCLGSFVGTYPSAVGAMDRFPGNNARCFFDVAKLCRRRGEGTGAPEAERDVTIEMFSRSSGDGHGDAATGMFSRRAAHRTSCVASGFLVLPTERQQGGARYEDRSVGPEKKRNDASCSASEAAKSDPGSCSDLSVRTGNSRALSSHPNSSCSNTGSPLLHHAPLATDLPSDSDASGATRILG